MAKSIHERVRAQLAKKAAADKLAADQATRKILSAAERLDIAHERGVERYIRGEELPRNASMAERAGYESAQRADMNLE